MTEAETLVAIRKNRGKRVLGEGFEGVVVCDDWRSYPNFTRRIQRCWVHLLREAGHFAERIEETKPLSEALHEMYIRLKDPTEDKPPPEEDVRLLEDARTAMDR